MKTPQWSETVLKIVEEKVTQLVNEMLSRSYGSCAKNRALILEIVEDLGLPIREEMEEVNKKIEALNDRVSTLAGQIDELRKNAATASGATKRKRPPKKAPPNG